MTGVWKVESNWIGDKKMFRVYRLRNIYAVDHSGNREYASEYTDDIEATKRLASRLNDHRVDCT